MSLKEHKPATPSSMDELVKPQTMRKGHNSFNPKNPHPSHFKTTLGTSTEDTSPISLDSKPQSSTTSSRIQRFGSRMTVALEENPAYHPLGGPDYIKVLAKYNLFGVDEHLGLVVCRFVNAGSSLGRHPQIIKVEQFSAQGNPEVLAHVVIGNPPQSMYIHT